LLRALFLNRARLAAENLALRQELAVLSRAKPKPKLCWQDRWFWVLLFGLCEGWQFAPRRFPYGLNLGLSFSSSPIFSFT
jgi:hypothetical protein